jgi:SAM-dependent methyltransferase
VDRSALPYWESFVGGSRGWIAPIAPAPEDIAHVERVVAGFRGGGVAALLLGVTQALAHMRWPAGSSLLAVDWSESMIRRIWRAAPAPAFAQVTRGDWRELPLRSASLDVVVGDGCYSAVGSRADAALTVREVHRVLKPGGLFCLRNFARPQQTLTVEALLAEVRAGRPSNAFLLRWLLAMAVHGASGDGVRLDDVFQAWMRRFQDVRALLAPRGLLDDAEWAFSRWQGLGVRYYFPDPAELHALASPAFDLVEYRVPAYERGECFPSLVMRRRS